MPATRFSDLRPGARFRFEEREWTKTGPLVAVSGDGEQRMIPRSAMVETLDERTATPAERPVGNTVDAERVAAGARAWHDRCVTILATLEDDDVRQRLRTELDAAYREFLTTVGQNP